MKRIIILLTLMLFFITFISADVIITEQPKEIYNFGDTLELPIKITATTNIQSSFKLNLICNGLEETVHFENIIMSTGEETTLKPIILLNKEFIERSGTCVLKPFLGLQAFSPTSEFYVSEFISVELSDHKTETTPKTEILVEGSARKENGGLVQGIVELKIIDNNETLIERTNTVKEGYFFLNFSFPKETPAGQYLVTINVYENDLNGEKTNNGFTNYNLLVTQVPTSLEIVFDTKQVEPGTDLRVKTVLHDQTGESIESLSVITIKNEDNEILEQVDIETDSFFEFPISYVQAPAEWKVFAASRRLTNEETFNITEKEDIEITLINRTVTIQNTGNVLYCNKIVLVKVGNDSLNIDVCLDVGGEQEYLLTAPEGEYQIEIIGEGEERIIQNVFLTGRVVDAKEISKKSFIRYSLVWIFIIAILGFVAFLFFKKGYRKSFFGYISKKKSEGISLTSKKSYPLNIKNLAELSLSIKGDKQNISLICLKIKNLKELVSNKSSSKETIQKIIDLSEEKKVAIYENIDNLFFLLAPVKTKTFKNERTAIELAQKIGTILTEHNKMMKDKIEFGISLNYGTIIAKQEKDSLKFMSMGSLITTAKKVANLSKGDVLLAEKIHDKVRTEVKTEKHTHGSTIVFSIREVRNREDHKNFLSNFVRRLEKEKQEKKEKEKKKE